MWLRRATALSLVGFLGCVGWTASFRNLEAESIAYKELVSDKWRDELPTAIVLDATDGLAVAVCHHFQSSVVASVDTAPLKKALGGGRTGSKSWTEFISLHPERIKGNK